MLNTEMTEITMCCGCAACQSALLDPQLFDLNSGSPSTSSEASALKLLSGYSWIVGDGEIFTYRFADELPSYYSDGDTEANNFMAFNAQMQSAATRVFAQLESFINIDFEETDDEESAIITFGQASLPIGTGAWAYYPSSNPKGADVWTNNIYANTQNPTEGNYAFFVILHELGHSLGLRHAFDLLSGDEATTQYSVMAYDWSPYFPSSYMVYDIAALQSLYGANESYNTGNDTYTLSTTEAYTIWDAGGTDTFDASAVSSNVILDLNEGAYSSVGLSNNIAIAFDVTIENARGGSGNDTIYGNEANNNLYGGGGNDALYASAGSDTIDGQSGTDTIYYDASFSDFEIAALNSTTLRLTDQTSTYGVDTVIGVENFVFNDITLTFAELYTFITEGGSNSAPIISGLTASTLSYSAGESVEADGSLNTSTTDAVPQLSGYTSSAGTLSVSGTWSNIYHGWNAFDNNFTGSARPWSDPWNGNEWIAFTFNDAKVINKYTMTSRSDLNGGIYSPKDWTFEASNDGVNWVTLDTRSSITGWGQGETRTFTFTNGTQYTTYRIDVSNNNNNNSPSVNIGELQFIEAQAGSGNPTLSIDDSINLLDLDSDNLSGATIKLSGYQHSIAEEVLAVTTQSGVSSSYAQSGGYYVLTLSGTASVSVYEQILESLTYKNNASTLVGGNRTLQITLTDEDGNIGAAYSVTIDVNGISAPPVAQNDSFSGTEDTPITGNLLADNGNGVDSDPEGDTLSVTAQTITSVQGGTVVIEADGDFTYTPAANFYGSDSFTYTLLDDQGGSDTGTVTLNITNVNDAPTANNDSANVSVNQSVSINVLANDSDPDGNALTVSITGAASNGTTVVNGNNTVTYTPNANYTGNDSFTYQISDGQGGTDTAVVSLSVAAKAAPVISGLTSSVDYSAGGIEANGALNTSTTDAVPQLSGYTSSAGTLSVSGTWSNIYHGWNAFDNNFTGSARPWSDPWNGDEWIAFTFNDAIAINKYTMTSRSDINGGIYSPKDWTFEASNDGVNWVTLDTRSSITGWGQGETRTFTFTNGTAYTTYRIDVSNNNNNNSPSVNIGELQFIAAQGGVNVQVLDSSITLSDSDSAIISGAQIRLSGYKNTIAEEVLAVTTQSGVSSSYSASGGDFVLTLSGNASVSAYEQMLESLTYKNTADTVIAGLRTLTFTVTDSDGTTSTAQTLNIDVDGVIVTTPPVAQNDSFSGTEDTPITGNLMANNGNGIDTDPDGDTLSVQAQTITSAQGGTVVIESDGDFTYTPAANFYGSDSFTYTLLDDQGGSDTGTVTLTLTNINDAPTANNDSASTGVDEAVIINVLSNDVDVDGNTLTVSIIGAASNGSTVVNGNNTVTYTPNANYTGNDTFTYQISDGQGGTDTAVVSLSVTANAAPVISGFASSASYTATSVEADGALNTSTTDAVPQLSGYTSSAGTLSVSGTWSNIYHGWNAFDNNFTGSARPWSDPWSGDEWIAFTFNDAKVINKYTMTSRSDFNGGIYSPKDWVFEASNDGVNWVTLDTRSSVTGWGQGETRTFTFTNGTAYTTYRIDVENNNNNNQPSVNIGELQFIEAQGGVNIQVLDSSITLSDSDSAIISSAEIRLSNHANSLAEEVLAVTTRSGVSASYAQSGGDYVLTLSGNASVSVYEQILETLTYKNIADTVVNGERTISLTVTDSDGATSATVTMDLDVTAADAIDIDSVLYTPNEFDALIGEADVFVFETSDLNNGSIDVIHGFNAAEGDALDISDLLEDYDQLTDAISDFVQITDNGTDSFVAVDQDGGGDHFVYLAILENVTGLTDEDTLYGSGNILIA